MGSTNELELELDINSELLLLKEKHHSASDRILLKDIIQKNNITIGSYIMINQNYANGVFEINGIIENGNGYNIFFKSNNKPTQIAPIEHCKFIKNKKNI